MHKTAQKLRVSYLAGACAMGTTIFSTNAHNNQVFSLWERSLNDKSTTSEDFALVGAIGVYFRFFKPVVKGITYGALWPFALPAVWFDFKRGNGRFHFIGKPLHVDNVYANPNNFWPSESCKKSHDLEYLEYKLRNEQNRRLGISK